MTKLIFCLILSCTPSVQGSIDYSRQYELSQSNRPIKSVGKIIREILEGKNKKKINNTFPIPLYDSIDPHRLKDIA